LKKFSTQAQLLQKIDRYLGVPVCFALTWLRRLSGLFGRTEDSAPSQSVLFLKLAEQGSTVLAYAAIRAAVERVGRAKVYFLVFEENRFIVDVLGLVPAENVFTIRTASAWTMATSCLGRLREIRRRRIDACIDLEFFARFSAAISYLTGARQRIGFHTYYGEGFYRGDLLTHRVLYNPHLHTSRTFASLVQALEVDPAKFPTFAAVPPPSAPPPLFQPSDEEQQTVRRIFATLGISSEQRLILLNANASDLLPLRKWDAQNYVALAQRLLAQFGDAAVVFTGAPDEAPKIEPLVRAVASPRCHSLAGKTTLRQLLVAYDLAEVLVTNDSGPAHFASLTGIDVVVLFGPETPALFAAPGPRNHVLWAGLACSPCINALNNRQTACRDNRCMKAITTDQVFATVCQVYRQRLPAPM
jgi:ADP-heptose:LPS heptosyltransferase